MKKRILVVEDDAPTRVLIRGVLKRGGYQVDAAKDGVEGLKKARAKEFDLVLTDIWMPRMNGLELLGELRKEPKPLRVVVMTSDSTPATVLRAIKEQAYHYLTKPVDPKALLEQVESAVATEGAAGPIEVLSASRDWVELLVPCEHETADRIQSFMEKLDADLPEEARDRVGRVFHEMLLNAIEWGGHLDPNRKVRISCLRAKRMVLYRIADPGTGFQFEDLPHAAVSYAPDQLFEHVEVRKERGLRPGGFGILMARAMVDELIYNEAHNEVVFVKYLD